MSYHLFRLGKKKKPPPARHGRRAQGLWGNLLEGGARVRSPSVPLPLQVGVALVTCPPGKGSWRRPDGCGQHRSTRGAGLGAPGLCLLQTRVPASEGRPLRC